MSSPCGAGADDEVETGFVLAGAVVAVILIGDVFDGGGEVQVFRSLPAGAKGRDDVTRSAVGGDALIIGGLVGSGDAVFFVGGENAAFDPVFF